MNSPSPQTIRAVTLATNDPSGVQALLDGIGTPEEERRGER